MILGGVVLGYWLPMLPFIRVAFSVMTWIVSVFEAVALFPIAAIAHITTEGKGLMGTARNVWMLWLNILRRRAHVQGWQNKLLVLLCLEHGALSAHYRCLA